MEGAPGHQAAPTHRGLYRNGDAPTFGGFDQMTAQRGRRVGLDARAAAGASGSRRPPIRTKTCATAAAISIPGQYSKTYVWARHERRTTSSMACVERPHVRGDGRSDRRDASLTVQRGRRYAQRSANDGRVRCVVRGGTALRVRLDDAPCRRRRTPMAMRPALDHVDLIVGSGRKRRFAADARGATRRWQMDARWAMADRCHWTIPPMPRGGFVRVRGSSTDEA